MPAPVVPQCLVLKSAVLSSLRPKLETRISPKQLLSMIFVGKRRVPVEEPSSTSCPWLCWASCRPRPFEPWHCEKIHGRAIVTIQHMRKSSGTVLVFLPGIDVISA